MTDNLRIALAALLLAGMAGLLVPVLAEDFPDVPGIDTPDNPPNRPNRPDGPGVIPNTPDPMAEMNRHRLPAHAAGHIVYTRHDFLPLPDGNKLPVGKLWVCNGDGTGHRKLISPDGPTTVSDANWAPDGRLLFKSDYQATLSCFISDIWMAYPDGAGMTRITGDAEMPAAPGRGSIVGLVDNPLPDEMRGQQVGIVVKGMNGRIFRPGGVTLTDERGERREHGGGFRIDGVPAGIVWVRCFSGKYMGDMKAVKVPAGGRAQVQLSLAEGNLSAGHPSMTPDGRYVVGVNSRHTMMVQVDLDPAISRKVSQSGLTLNFVTIYDRHGYGAPIVTLDAGALGDRTWFANQPRVSPDGKWVAFVLGAPGQESLVLTSFDDLLHGRNRVRQLRAGEMHAVQATTVGHSSPVFSPDSSKIAFVRYVIVGGNVTGNLCVCNLDGSGARQLTNVARNQCVDRPTWSPDGSRIAFQVATSRHELLNLIHVVAPIGQHYTCDIYAIDLRSGQVGQVTNAGVCIEPAWGR